MYNPTKKAKQFKNICKKTIVLALILLFGVGGSIYIKSLTNDKKIEVAIVDKLDLYAPSEKYKSEAETYKKEIETLRRENEHLKTSRGSPREEVRVMPTPIAVQEEKFNRDKVIQAISNNLQGVFRGKAPFIYDISKKYNVNPMLVTAICYHETGNGTSRAVVNLNNTGGLMGRRGLMRFNTLNDGIEAMIKNLKTNYIDYGLTSIEQIQKKYCPVGASNDPTLLNKYWLPMVTEKYQKILEESK